MDLYPSLEGYLVYMWCHWCAKAGETPSIILFHSSAVQGGQGRVVGPYPLWDSVSGSPVRWGVWSIPSPKILGRMQCFIGPLKIMV